MGVFRKLFGKTAKSPTGKDNAGYKCRSCSALQAFGAWEAAMDAQAKAMGSKGFYNISAKPECLKCGSLSLIDLQEDAAVEPQHIDVFKFPERKELIALCGKYTKEVERYRSGYSGASDNMDRLRSEIRTIGEKVGDKGGISLMRELGESLDDPRWRNVVDSSWDGIHGWMY